MDPRTAVVGAVCRPVAGRRSSLGRYVVEVASFVGTGTLLVLYLGGCVVEADIIGLGFGVPDRVMRDRFGLVKGCRFVVGERTVVGLGNYAVVVSRRLLGHRRWLGRIPLAWLNFVDGDHSVVEWQRSDPLDQLHP